MCSSCWLAMRYGSDSADLAEKHNPIEIMIALSHTGHDKGQSAGSDIGLRYGAWSRYQDKIITD